LDDCSLGIYTIVGFECPPPFEELVPTNGLFSMVDSARYSGGGDVWSDMSGNGMDWTLRNPSFNVAGSYFSNGNDRLAVSPDLSSVTTGDLTVIAVFDTTDTKVKISPGTFSTQNYSPQNSQAFGGAFEGWHLDGVDQGSPADQTKGSVYAKILDGKKHVLELQNIPSDSLIVQKGLANEPDLRSAYPGARFQYALKKTGDSWDISNGKFYGFMIYTRKLTDIDRLKIIDYWGV
jgi:hypothetical protein